MRERGRVSEKTNMEELEELVGGGGGSKLMSGVELYLHFPSCTSTSEYTAKQVETNKKEKKNEYRITQLQIPSFCLVFFSLVNIHSSPSHFHFHSIARHDTSHCVCVCIVCLCVCECVCVHVCVFMYLLVMVLDHPTELLLRYDSRNTIDQSGLDEPPNELVMTWTCRHRPNYSTYRTVNRQLQPRNAHTHTRGRAGETNRTNRFRR